MNKKITTVTKIYRLIHLDPKKIHTESENIFSEEIFDTIILDKPHILLNIEDLEEIELPKKK